MATKFTVTTKGIPEVQALLKKFTGPDVKRTLHQRWGLQGMNWVDQNFKQQGALTGTPWAALKPSTIAAKGSSSILQDTGRLKQSFVMRFDETQAAIGSPVFYGAYHEEGRTGPWAIRPKNPGGVLAWKGIDGKMVFRKSVMHPGYPQRRMLPRQTDETFMSKIRLVATNLFNELSGK